MFSNNINTIIQNSNSVKYLHLYGISAILTYTILNYIADYDYKFTNDHVNVIFNHIERLYAPQNDNDKSRAISIIRTKLSIDKNDQSDIYNSELNILHSCNYHSRFWYCTDINEWLKSKKIMLNNTSTFKFYSRNYYLIKSFITKKFGSNFGINLLPIDVDNLLYNFNNNIRRFQDHDNMRYFKKQQLVNNYDALNYMLCCVEIFKKYNLEIA